MRLALISQAGKKHPMHLVVAAHYPVFLQFDLIQGCHSHVLTAWLITPEVSTELDVLQQYGLDGWQIS